MRRVGAGITAAVLLAGLAASAALAQDTDGDLHSAPTPGSTPKSWWAGWFGPAAKTDKPESKKPEAAAPPAPVAPSPVELAAAARQRERAAFNRRMEVCDRLTEIAVQNNDTAMQSQIDQLRDRAWEVYQKRTADLPAAGSTSQDEALPDRSRPSKPLSAVRADGKAGTDDGSVVREVKP